MIRRRRLSVHDSYLDYFLKRWSGPAMLVIAAFVCAFVFFWAQERDEAVRRERLESITAYHQLIKQKAAEARERGD